MFDERIMPFQAPTCIVRLCQHTLPSTLFMKTLLTNAGWSAAAHLLERGSLVLVSIILSRMLDTAGFAAYGYFQMTVSMLAAYAAMGLGVTSSKFFAESDQLSPGAMPPLGTLWVLSVLSGLLLALVILLVPSSWRHPKR